MISFNLKKCSSIKITWIITYIILFFIPVFIYITMFVIIDGKIKNEVNKSNSILLKQVQQYMDTLASDTETLAIDLAFNERVQKIRGMEGNISDEEQFKLLELYRDARNKLYNNDAIEEVYIYFKKIDTVVSSNYIMQSDIFFKTFCQNNNIDLNEWLQINSDTHRGEYINLKDKGLKNHKLTYMLSIPNNTNIDGNANIVVVIDKSRFLSMAKDIEALSKGSVAILNTRNEIILSSDGSEVLKNIKYENLTEESNVVQENIGNKKVSISYIDSKIKRWKYIYSMPVTEYWSTLEQFRKIINLGLIFSFIIGCSAIYLSFKRNYKPVNKLLNTLSSFNNKTIEGEENEFNIIENVMIKSLNEKKEVETWISSQKEVLKCRYIERLLKSTVIDNDLTNEEMLDISFSRSSFIVMAFYIEEFERISGKISSNALEAFKLLQFVTHNILEELIQDAGRVYTIDMDNHIVSLLNIAPPSNTKQYFKDISSKMQGFLLKYYNVGVTIVVSKIYDETSSINKAYKETVDLLEFREVVGGEGILLYDEINNTSSYKYYYPIEYEQALINAVKVGDYHKVEIIIEDIFNKNLDEKVINNALVKCLRFNLIGTMTNTVNELVDIYGAGYFKYLTAIEEMIQEKNIKKVKEFLLNTLKDICERIETDRKTGSQIGNRVISYITDNYKDENLNLTILAQVFDMNPAYMSRQFKMQTGYGMLDYINKVRIEAAKKLLKNDSDNLENIAKNVGYSNVRTFTRAFVKIEGITPGKYKGTTFTD